MPKPTIEQIKQVDEEIAQLQAGDEPAEGLESQSEQPQEEVTTSEPDVQPVNGSAPSGVESSDGVDWQHKYKTVDGMLKKVNEDSRTYRAQSEEYRVELDNLRAQLDAQQQAKEFAPAAKPLQEKPSEMSTLVTDADREEYESEYISLIQRAANDAMIPIVDGLVQRIGTLETALSGLDKLPSLANKVQHVATQQQQNNQDVFYERLSSAVPDWRAVNEEAGFREWLNYVDPMSDISKQALLDDAASRLDADRVALIFNSWKGTTSQEAPASAQQPLGEHESPKKGRGAPSRGSSTANYTHSDLQKILDTGRRTGWTPELRQEEDVVTRHLLVQATT